MAGRRRSNDGESRAVEASREIREETSVRKVAFASAIGATIEWYDFFLYGTAAALVFNQLFFPAGNPTAGTLAAYATFAAGFVARPIGGLIFGHFGDRVGRKKMLVLTLIIMGIATFMIGLLPTYGQIGIWAPVLLLTLRVVQGIGLGGEWGGAVLMAVEHAPEGRRGYFGSWPQVGVPAGLLLGTTMFTLLSVALTDAQFLTWGWRAAFLSSAILVVVGAYIRLQILESPAFAQVSEAQEVATVPFVELMRTQPREVILGVGTRFAEGVSFNTFGVFVITYLTTTLSLPRTTALLGVSIAAVLTCVLTPVFGAVSDRVGRRPVFGLGAALFGLFAIPSFLLFNTGQVVWIVAALVVAFGLIHPMIEATLASFWSELFETRVRYSGLSFIYQFSGIFASGLTPLIATWLLSVGGGDPSGCTVATWWRRPRSASSASTRFTRRTAWTSFPSALPRQSRPASPSRSGGTRMHYRQHKGAAPRVEGRKAEDRSLRTGGRLPAILKLNLAFLVGLAALSFFLPFSSTERWFLAVPVALLAGVNWALLERAEMIPPKPPARGG